jgi:hypothetical protein
MVYRARIAHHDTSQPDLQVPGQSHHVAAYFIGIQEAAENALTSRDLWLRLNTTRFIARMRDLFQEVHDHRACLSIECAGRLANQRLAPSYSAAAPGCDNLASDRRPPGVRWSTEWRRAINTALKRDDRRHTIQRERLHRLARAIGNAIPRRSP